MYVTELMWNSLTDNIKLSAVWGTIQQMTELHFKQNWFDFEEEIRGPHLLLLTDVIVAVCSIVRWQPIECRSKFSQLDDNTDVQYVNDTDVGTDDWQCDVTESGADDESDVDVKRQRQRLPGDVSHVDTACRAGG